MIALLQGEVAVRRGDHVVVLCGGVGYRLAVSAETLRHVPRVGQPATLLTHLIVRDDALLLYGFATEEERDLFLLLIGVQSVGPKMALAVLSGGPPHGDRALEQGDHALSAAASGAPFVWQMATASASAAWSGRGRSDSASSVWTMRCTWTLAARPEPQTAPLTCCGV